MATNGLVHPHEITNTNQEPLLSRADEVKELLDAVQKLIIPFIRAADEDANTKHTGHGLVISGDGPRTTLVESHLPQKLEQLLDLQIPHEGGGKDGLLDILQKILQYSVNTWDQGFMDKLYASTNAVGLVSELILAVLNTNVHVYQVSPVLTLIEKHTTRLLASLIGFDSPHAGGISQPGGSASNSSALVIARNTLFPDTKTAGLGGRRFVLFTSAHGHYSLEKAAQMFGFGSDAVKSVPVDADGRMKPEELDAMIEAAKESGETPFFVNATAGTTVLGSFDPLEAIADICAKHALWMHVDGSWGGSVVFNAELKASRLKGIERADSVVITPHKMLGVPMTCSFLIGRDLRQFWSAMTLPAGYLFHTTPPTATSIYDLADLTPQCGRRGDSLKLYLALTYYGLPHYSRSLSHAFATASRLASLLSSSPHIVLTSPSPLPCLQVCFYWARDRVLSEDAEVNGEATERIARGLVRRGWMVDFAPGERGRMFRVVVGLGTRRATVEGLVRAIEEVAGEEEL